MSAKELCFTFAYSFADRVVTAVKDGSDDEKWLPDFLDARSEQFVKKVFRPQKDTLLHDLIRNLNMFDLDYSTGHCPEESVAEYIALLQAARLSIPEWLHPDRVADHIRELDRMLESAATIIAEPTFHLLFADRGFLVLFQDLLASQISQIDASRYPTFFNRSGISEAPHLHSHMATQGHIPPRQGTLPVMPCRPYRHSST